MGKDILILLNKTAHKCIFVGKMLSLFTGNLGGPKFCFLCGNKEIMALVYSRRESFFALGKRSYTRSAIILAFSTVVACSFNS